MLKTGACFHQGIGIKIICSLTNQKLERPVIRNDEFKIQDKGEARNVVCTNGRSTTFNHGRGVEEFHKRSGREATEGSWEES